PSAFVRSADATPTHMDLGAAAHVLTTTSSRAATSLAADYTRMRRYWVTAIAWRAAAISADPSGHPDALWTPSADNRTATLNTDPMNELIDRRLRTCERMHHHVSSARALAPSARLSGTVATGPWQDGFQIRMFEYPRVRVSFGPTIPADIGAANI